LGISGYVSIYTAFYIYSRSIATMAFAVLDSRHTFKPLNLAVINEQELTKKEVFTK